MTKNTSLNNWREAVSNLIQPGQGIVYMKVGVHAQESLEDIISRKTKEIDEAGYALWGYGGNTCHPRSMVQPFASSFEKQGRQIYLCMQEMNSRHFAEPVRADQASPDGLKWEDIPAQINVLGSRFALVIKSLKRDEFDLSLDDTRVAVGRSAGNIGSKYISGQVDKACLTITDHVGTGDDEGKKLVRIGLVAELANPYAVFLRNRPQ